MEAQIASLYENVKAGNWRAMHAAMSDNPSLGKKIAEFAKPSSGWSFLHQAAYFGDHHAIRELIRHGADIHLKSKDGQSPVDVARQQGKTDAAELIRASEVGNNWSLPKDRELRPDTLPSSCLWNPAKRMTATKKMVVYYAGAQDEIEAGDNYYVDSYGRVLVGWHGTRDPPSDMDGYPLIQNAD
eukprot:GILI01016217.1.p1 GENE.GILI01016217.1~~GILI01016217.1.p1  ORF type:complete len:194 (+),score=28.75 GILI01016217.1:30-584(+)